MTKTTIQTSAGVCISICCIHFTTTRERKRESHVYMHSAFYGPPATVIRLYGSSCSSVGENSEECALGSPERVLYGALALPMRALLR
ncbi:hypothetical protein STCU_11432 [Strigomonas culicis]|uniref:Uncharacterized protein n=1 Tax=Strigomonas culicis TaxID=28005 RepID=S9TH75_9TRYP|nr:hypothetical protein STCU_11432 [Strigomonas culicis]|eukprot:EPY16274.1 hypothetical protein STCU_11432 [Strigomonas culicis]